MEVETVEERFGFGTLDDAVTALANARGTELLGDEQEAISGALSCVRDVQYEAEDLARKFERIQEAHRREEYEKARKPGAV
jgi:hypothetical protein